jgi:release factor glutamine methyltransferase
VTSIGDLILQGATRLRLGPHPKRARRDAETLLLHVLDKERAWLFAHSAEELPTAEEGRFAALIERRCVGEPIQYVTGEQEFYGLPFRVNDDVLIPRPETEHLVEKALELAGRFQRPRIVDVGTGSGAIAVALAHKLPKARITAVDISGAALDVARGNAERNGVARRIEFKESDLLAAVADERFEMVVSNPPYVPVAERDALAVEVREHEPAVALFGGEGGLALYRRLIPAAFAVLAPRGWLAMEIGYGQSKAIARLMSEAGFERVEFVPDLQGIARVVSARRV